MTDIIASWLALIAPFWPWLKALTLALMFSWVATQLIKTGWRVLKASMQFAPPDAVEKLALRTVATILCFIPLYELWPDPDDAIWWALVTSMLSPAIYKVATFMLYDRFPMLEKALSANPVITIRRDEHGTPIGIKEGDDKTIFFDIGSPTPPKGDNETTQPRDPND